MKNIFLVKIVTVFFFSFLPLRAIWAEETRICSLKVQNHAEPLAVEDIHPLFSWQMQSDVTGQKQQAYRIAVIRESDKRIVWDSQKVESGISNNIPYTGVALQPDMSYRWQLTVWDVPGKEHSASSRFETGLMNPKISVWDGAQWIGSKELNLDATSDNYFELTTTFQLLKGDKASLILGANDFRLTDPFQNPDNLSGENYVRVELDLSGVGSGQGAVLNIYRVGYARDDRADVPFITISAAKFPQTNINSLFTPENKEKPHTFSVFTESSNLYFIIDGEDLLTKPVEQSNRPSHGFAVGRTNLKVSAATRFNVGPWGRTHDFNTLPHLSAVGFAALPGCEVEYTGYRIQNCGHSIHKVVFDSGNYSIFAAIPNVEVNGRTITVSNSSDRMTIGYADPSHSALTMVRTAFKTHTEKTIAKAKLYVTAMGAYEMFINGERMGEDWFNPGSSQFREVMGYHAYDVTEMLENGENVIGAQLSAGFYTGYMTFSMSNFNFFGDNEALLAKLIITYDDGSKQTVVTDPQTWKVFKDGPVRYGSFFHGERYDANREAVVDGWTTAAYNDSAWKAADIIRQRNWVNFDLIARYDSPVRVRETLLAKRVMPVHSADGHTYIYDMGVNMVGVPSVTIPAGWLKKGDVIIMRYAEQLYPGFKGDDKYYVDAYGKKGKNIAGRPLYETMRAALVTDFYTAKDNGVVTIQPTTTYRGYQYIQITLPGHKGALPLENVKGLVLSSDELPAGRYEAVTADGNKTGKLVNQLFKNIQRSQLGNFFTLPTDCPQRNERMGWTGDAQAYVRTATCHSDVLNFFRQWMITLRADQGTGSATEAPGGIGSTVPTYNQSDDSIFADGTTWAAAVCMVPWQLYIQYGNTQVIEENMDAMMAWLNGMDFYDFSETCPHLSGKTTGLADWLAMDSRTPPDIVNNAIYIYMMEVTAQMADAIGRTEDAEILRKRHALAKAEWNSVYVDPATGKTKTADGKIIHSQSSYATPLNFNCFNDQNKAQAEAWLAALSAVPSSGGEEKRKYPDYTITTGFSGTPNILPALSRAGHVEEAFRMFSCTDFPSWLYPVTKGATSVWERWNGYEMAFGETKANNMNSFNHFALGAVGQWMYEYQLGITNDYSKGASGYKQFILQPSAGAGYLSLSGSYDSHYGKITSVWTADGNGVMTAYRATVPANTTATLYLPVGDTASDFDSIPGVTFVRKTVHHSVPVAQYELTSGTFAFTIEKDRVTVE
jgi:alpha-L-rhamnosidase